MKARRLTFILPIVIVFALTQATAEGSSIPLNLPGLNGVGEGPMQDGPIYTMLKKLPDACTDVAVFGYSDGAAATVGLASYLRDLNMTPQELERTDTTVAWIARSGYNELLGVWQAKAGGGGKLELCALRPRHTLTSTSGDSTNSGSVGDYGYGGGGLGGLGLLMWYFRRRLRG